MAIMNYTRIHLGRYLRLVRGQEGSKWMSIGATVHALLACDAAAVSAQNYYKTTVKRLENERGTNIAYQMRGEE